MDAIVSRLVALVDEHGWRPRFETAVSQLCAQRIPSLAAIRTPDDVWIYLDDLVHWAPREQGDSRLVHDKLVEFHAIFSQPAVLDLQSPIAPAAASQADSAMSAEDASSSSSSSSAQAAPLTPLSAWIVDFARAWGGYLDTPASARHVDSFRTDPAFRWDDYMPPPSGYLTFNQFFARHVKPGRRPIDEPHDDRVVVSPADANFIGQWPVAADSTITVSDQRLELKGLRWSLKQLLADSPYADRFAGGMLTHSALRTFDYHRWHAPLAGEVLEARVISGQAWLEVKVIDTVVDGVPQRALEAVEGTCYQFVQTRGLVVLDTPAGLVACLPVGMAQVSSVVITAEVGARLRKGEEMGYFQFGGSDFVMVFETGCGVVLEGRAGEHVQQGRRVGRCCGSD